MNKVKKIGFVLGMLLMMNLCVSSLLSHYGTVSSSFTVVSSLDEGCEYYDTFSSETLDNSKWIEVVATDIPPYEMTNEHYVIDGIYHTAQTIDEFDPNKPGWSYQSDRGTGLVVKNYVFQYGDIIEYDVNYISGQGNRMSTIMLNGDALSAVLIGYLNGIHTEGSNEYGIHHVKLTFLGLEGVKIEIIRPNGVYNTWMQIYSKLGTYPAQEYTFGIVTRNGHNGLVHMNYDNVVICKNQN